MQQQTRTSNIRERHHLQYSSPSHQARVKQQLRDLGLSRMGLFSLETGYLPRIVHPDETIGGVVYGLHEGGLAMLIATDRRVIFLDKSLLFTNEDEINYFVVGGIRYSHAGIGSTITLHTRIRDYTLRTLNQHCAAGFRNFIEQRCLEQKGEQYDQPA